MSTKTKILIVDDRPENLVSLKIVLKDLDIEFVEATSGNDALKKTLHHDFALALLDIQMEGMDGYELATILREEEKTAYLPFIFISAVYIDNTNVFKGYEKGAFSFITKPFQPEILINKVKFFIDKHQQEIAFSELNKELKSKNKELSFQNEEKEKRAKELILIDKELVFQNGEKEKSVVDLKVANKKLAFEIEEKRKRAAELNVANKEIVFQKDEKEKRAEELIVADKEIVFQKGEKEKRAAELILANKELVFQNKEKEKRAAELTIANSELIFQNKEKEKRAAELIIANEELVFQNEEKEKRATELTIANKELEQLTYIASHDLQEPLRTISNYMKVFEEDYLEQLDDNASNYIRSVNNAAKRMSVLVQALLGFSRLGRDKKLTHVNCKKLIDNVIADLQTVIKDSNTTIDVGEMPELNIYETEIGQLFQNLITNAIKFQKKDTRPQIQISSKKVNEKWQFSVSDNGIGIAPVHYDRIFDIFQRLHVKNEYQGNGIGLANCKKIVALHHGEIWIESILGKGATFNFTIPHLSL